MKPGHARDAVIALFVGAGIVLLTVLLRLFVAFVGRFAGL